MWLWNPHSIWNPHSREILFYLSIHLSIYLSLSIYRSIHPSIYLSIYLSSVVSSPLSPFDAIAALIVSHPQTLPSFQSEISPPSNTNSNTKRNLSSHSISLHHPPIHSLLSISTLMAPAPINFMSPLITQHVGAFSLKAFTWISLVQSAPFLSQAAAPTTQRNSRLHPKPSHLCFSTLHSPFTLSFTWIPNTSSTFSLGSHCFPQISNWLFSSMISSTIFAPLHSSNSARLDLTRASQATIVLTPMLSKELPPALPWVDSPPSPRIQLLS